MNQCPLQKIVPMLKIFKIQRSIYKIPKDVIELEKEFLFPLMKGREIEKFKNIYSDIVVPFPSCAAIPIASSAN